MRKKKERGKSDSPPQNPKNPQKPRLLKKDAKTGKKHGGATGLLTVYSMRFNRGKQG